MEPADKVQSSPTKNSWTDGRKDSLFAMVPNYR